MKQIIGILLIATTFAAAGWLTAAQAAPAAVVWSTLGLLGLGAVVLLFVLRSRTAAPGAAGPVRRASERVVPKDGRDYRVDVDDEKFSLTDLRTGEAASMAWRELTSVHVVAADGCASSGDISYVVHQGGRTLEIPLGAGGNESFLAAMQEKLVGFDNGALIEGMAMLHGCKQVWPAQAPAPTPPAAAAG